MAVQSREDIAELWLWRVLRSYPCQSAEFLATERDPFRNPVGNTFRRALGILLDELLLAAWTGAALPRRSIPSCRSGPSRTSRPAGRWSFCSNSRISCAIRLPEPDRELLDGRIDELALLAFDLYVKYRERTYQAKANEARRRVFVLERRLMPCESGGLAGARWHLKRALAALIAVTGDRACWRAWRAGWTGSSRCSPSWSPTARWQFF